jgi:hypothetical protein
MMMALAAGCVRRTDDYGGGASPSDATYEVAPLRMVIGADSGTKPGGGTDDPGGGSAGGASGAGAGGTSGGAGGTSGSGGTAEAVSCNVARADCQPWQTCLPSVFAKGDDNGGICYPAGPKGLKQSCVKNEDCGNGLICSPYGTEGCRPGCDPAAGGACAEGVCKPMAAFRHTGFCGDM